MNNSKILKQFVKNPLTTIRLKNTRKKIQANERALEHFDEYYLNVYNKQWPSIRQGLLGKQKYVAVVNNYSDTEQITSVLENCGALNMRALFLARKKFLHDDFKNIKRDNYLKKIWKLDEESKQNQETEETQNVNEFCDNYKANYDQTRYIESDVGFSSPILQDFVPASEIKGKENWVSESDYYKHCKVNEDFKVEIEKEYDFNFPEHLNVYCFPESSSSSFTQPRKGSTGVLNYYLLDGGSVLPVLALDIRPGNTVLDLCASPGGKSLLALQTLYPDCVISNDISQSRINRIYKVFGEYLYDFEDRWLQTKRCKITQNDGRFISGGQFDRVLVDVPCTTDKHSVKESDNNIFKPTRIRERLKLPELQTELLINALKLVKKGGIVVYSTCSLSPVQNDGVVHMALQQLWEERGIKIILKNLDFALVKTQDVFKFANPNIFRYGNLVLPHINQNYGPTYFCKMQRVN